MVTPKSATSFCRCRATAKFSYFGTIFLNFFFISVQSFLIFLPAAARKAIFFLNAEHDLSYFSNIFLSFPDTPPFSVQFFLNFGPHNSTMNEINIGLATKKSDTQGSYGFPYIPWSGASVGAHDLQAPPSIQNFFGRTQLGTPLELGKAIG